MSETCAVCRESDAEYEHYAWYDWVDYLREERGMDPKVGATVIPVCLECDRELDDLANEWQEREGYPEERRIETVQTVHSTLDDVDLDLVYGDH